MKKWTPLLLCLLTASYCRGQEKDKYRLVTVAFYNVENLFDTVDEANKDEEFLPTSARLWGTERYKKKLERLSEVLDNIGDKDGPEVFGLAEIENRKVVEDLIGTDRLKSKSYEIIHFESPDERGIDVALVYKKTYFFPILQKVNPITLPDDSTFKTRDVLLVKGLLDGDTVSFVVNHWPSRGGGGQAASESRRIAAAKVSRHVVDSLLSANQNEKIILMGDFNDEPSNKSICNVLRCKSKPEELKQGELYNPMADLEKKDLGSYAYKGFWDMLDQFMLSSALLNPDSKGYFYMQGSANIHCTKEMQTKTGDYKGYPFKTFAGTTYQGGYSDHFPVFMWLVKKMPSK